MAITRHELFDRIEYRDGDLLHRDDGGPAVEYANGGRKQWYRFGKLHRDGAPAIEDVNGGRMWYVHGKCHRDDGPAAENPNGRWWYKHGEFHRIGGPAIEYCDGITSYYLDGECYTPLRYWEAIWCSITAKGWLGAYVAYMSEVLDDH